ncbi:MAG: TonB-dependent receptor [Sulfurovum sp.]|nr:TonB-dependent receptor [Sulfurovum sp.]
MTNHKITLSLVCSLTLLSASSVELGTISVDSSTIDDKFDAKSLEVSSTATLSGEEVEDFHAENIANVLNTIPGVTVRENENDSNKIHIRGIAAEMYMGEKPGVAIVIDGVPVQERAGSVNIDSDNIESIKVIKGGASYLYGNDALAGAVIITTKRPKAKDEGFASIEQGSFGYEKYIARYNYSNDKFAVEVQGSYKGSDGYWEDSDYWTKSINGKLQYYIDETSDITIGIDRTKRYENDTGSITYATYNPDTKVYSYNAQNNPKSFGEVGYATDYDISLDKYFITYSKDFENNSNLMVQVYRYEDETTNKSAAFDSNGDGLRDDHLYDSYASTIQNGLKAEYRMSGDVLASMIGIDIARNDMEYNRKYRVDYTDYRHTFHPIGEVTGDTSGNEDINAIYGELKYAATKALTLTANARYDQIKYDYTDYLEGGDYSDTFYETSYRLGTTYKFDETMILYSNISTGFRVPQLTQIFAGDIYGQSWDGSIYLNNPDLKTETTINYEIGLRHKTEFFSYDISIYQLDRKDVIGKSNGNYASADRGDEVFYNNNSDVRSRGLELSLSTDRKKPYYFIFNYTYLDSTYTRYDNYYIRLEGEDTSTKYDVTGNRVPRTSKHTIYAEANYRPVNDLLLTAGLFYRSSQFADERNEIEVGGYSVLNLRAKYNTKVASYPVEFFFNANNVLDKQYYMMPRVTGDRNDDGLYDIRDMGLTVNPGRTFIAGLSVKF